MSQHTAIVRWTNENPEFARGRYSRAHTWSFDGGAVIPAAASPAIVRPPLTDPSGVDPEEAFVASIASCHMLTFLHLASRRGFDIAAYEDAAVGEMTKNEHGVPWISAVVLSPHVQYRGERAPTAEESRALHEEAHRQCFIAQSVKTSITVAGG